MLLADSSCANHRDISHRLHITNANNAVDLAYNKYGDHSIPLATGRDNYLIVVEDALDAAANFKPET